MKKKSKSKNIFKFGVMEIVFTIIVTLLIIGAILTTFIKFEYSKLVSLSCMMLSFILGTMYFLIFKNGIDKRKRLKDKLSNNFLQSLNIKLNSRYLTTKQCILSCSEELSDYKGELDLVEKFESSSLTIFNKENPYYFLLVSMLYDGLNDDKEINKDLILYVAENYLKFENKQSEPNYNLWFDIVIAVFIILFIVCLSCLFSKVIL